MRDRGPAKVTEAEHTRQTVDACQPGFCRNYIALAAAVATIAAAAVATFLVQGAAPLASAASSLLTSSPSLLHLVPGNSHQLIMRSDRARKGQQQPLMPQTFTDGGPLPACLAFDLDYTLWPFWIDTHVYPPLREPKAVTDRGKFALDAHGKELSFYCDVPRVLAGARAAGIKVAAASRTHAPELAQRLLRLLRIPAVETGEAVSAVEDAVAAAEVAPSSELAVSYFDNLQIYPGNKLRHLQRIAEALDVSFDDIVFFDDEARNRNVEQLGVRFADVPCGLDAALVDAAIEAWRRLRQQ